MAKKPYEKTNEKLAPGLVKNTLKLIRGFLVFVGKPFYIILSSLFVSTVFISYLLGDFVTNKLPNFINRIIRIPQPKVRLSLPSLPKISFPQIKISFNKRFVVFVLMVSFLGFLVWNLILKDLPSPKQLVIRDQEVSTKIYDRNGVLLYKIFKDKNRTLVSLDKIPPQVRLATLAAEDAEFYLHPGFSVRGMIRALAKNIKKGQLSGGSTITQQLVKNALLSSEKTITRKIREIILSVGVELSFSKDQILEMYLNEVSYGGTAYGIQEAAQVYFGKDVDKLTLAEAALLAGLPQSPTKYSPFGSTPDLAFARQKEVLNLMVVNRYIDKEQQIQAANQRITFAANKTDIKAPHFVMYVRNMLVDRLGEEVVEKGGLEVVTTLDYSIQRLAEEAVKSEVEKLSSLNVGNGAALVLNPQTGEVLAMVGSKNYFDTANDGNVNVTTRLRQPGSSIKIINYAYALSNGYTPASILDDSPVTFSVPGLPPYSPKNYDGAYRGKISLRSALAESRNIPAVKVLASYGVNKMIEMGQKMGITSWGQPDRFGLSLTLGGGEVKLIDLATAYATVANFGKKPEVKSILKITNYKGKVIEQDSCNEGNLVSAAEAAKPLCEQTQVLDPRVSFLLIDILKDNKARSPAFGSNSSLVVTGHPEVAVKTGTSNDLKDNLTLGFNQKYLVATWVGNNSGSPMSRIASGITGAAPIWNKIMRGLLAKEKNHDWEVPKGLAQLSICSLTGTLTCSGCPTRLEWFLEEKKPTKSCSLEQIVKIQEESKKEGQILEPAFSTSVP